MTDASLDLNVDFISSSEIILSNLYFRPKFGKVITLLDKHQFLDAIDKENPNVIVVVHLYSEVMLPLFAWALQKR